MTFGLAHSEEATDLGCYLLTYIMVDLDLRVWCSIYEEALFDTTHGDSKSRKVPYPVIFFDRDELRSQTIFNSHHNAAGRLAEHHAVR